MENGPIVSQRRKASTMFNPNFLAAGIVKTIGLNHIIVKMM